MNTASKIRERLITQLNPTHLEVIDESADHIDHHAPAGMGHYTVIITSPAFVNLTLPQKHRAIYKALGELMQTDIHALRIEVRD